MDDHHVLWWGEPWPSPDLRAPVCEDDTYRVDVPVGAPCYSCEKTIVEGDRGISLRGVAEDGSLERAHAHVQCLLPNVVVKGHYPREEESTS